MTVVATGPTYQAVEGNVLKNAMQQQHNHEMQKQRIGNEEVQNQIAGIFHYFIRQAPPF